MFSVGDMVKGLKSLKLGVRKLTYSPFQVSSFLGRDIGFY